MTSAVKFSIAVNSNFARGVISERGESDVEVLN
jgi:hypothetical protein